MVLALYISAVDSIIRCDVLGIHVDYDVFKWNQNPKINELGIKLENLKAILGINILKF